MFASGIGTLHQRLNPQNDKSIMNESESDCLQLRAGWDEEGWSICVNHPQTVVEVIGRESIESVEFTGDYIK